jgi:hypothetical protein
MSNHGYRFQKLKDLKIGIDIYAMNEEFMKEMNELATPFVKKVETDKLTLLDQLSLSISIYFALDSLKSKVPEEF